MRKRHSVPAVVFWALAPILTYAPSCASPIELPLAIIRTAEELRRSPYFARMARIGTENRAREARDAQSEPEWLASGIDVQDGWLHLAKQAKGGGYVWMRLPL